MINAVWLTATNYCITTVFQFYRPTFAYHCRPGYVSRSVNNLGLLAQNFTHWMSLLLPDQLRRNPKWLQWNHQHRDCFNFNIAANYYVIKTEPHTYQTVDSSAQSYPVGADCFWWSVSRQVPVTLSAAVSARHSNNHMYLLVNILTTTRTYWLTFKSHSIITFSLHFNCHFSRWTWVSRFIEAKDDGSGGDNISCKSCKAPVISSPPTTNQHPNFYRPDAFVSPNQQCQSSERRHSITSLSFNSTS